MKTKFTSKLGPVSVLTTVQATRIYLKKDFALPISKLFIRARLQVGGLISSYDIMLYGCLDEWRDIILGKGMEVNTAKSIVLI